MVIKLNTNTEFEADFMDIIRAFAPNVTVGESGTILQITVDKSENTNDFGIIECGGNEEEKRVMDIRLTFNGRDNLRKINVAGLDEIHCKSEIKRLAKIMLYQVLSELTGRKLPYGSLTGIRPTKLFHDLAAKGIDAYRYFTDYLLVSEEKTKLIEQICENQKGIYHKDDKEIDFFVNIPICVSRCSYCSFISAEYSKITKWIEPYVSQLVREIERAKQIILNNRYTVRSIYIGGGTPTSLNEKDLARVLDAVKGLKCQEFTLEAGRPDTITEEKLSIMADAGVNRISINPQTFNDKTLELIGRKHDIQMLYDVYNKAKKYNFIINMDLIAMLPNESLEDFKYSVDKCIELNPNNITVHTLAIKRGSNLKLDNYDNLMSELAQAMVDYSADALSKAGYRPYYMYKQKYMSGNLENVGYCKGDTACIYNVDIMEETHSIIANGAGGMSKRVWNEENRLERLANPKGIDVYLDREEKINGDKIKFFA